MKTGKKAIGGISILLGLLLLPLTAEPAHAQDTPVEARNVLAFYFWGPDINVDLTVRNTTVPADVSFSDVLDKLDFGGFLHYEWGPRPWGFAFDTMYVDLSTDFTGTGPGPAAGTVSLTLWEAEAEALRRWANSTEKLYFDLILGLRYWSLSQTIDPTTAAPVEGDKTWLDGVVGGRLIKPLGNKWLFSLRMDVATGGSDIAWNGAALFDWQFSRVASLLFGYRYLYEDYEDGEGLDRFGLDGTMAGPAVGLGFQW
jgi:hypothetical protein